MRLFFFCSMKTDIFYLSIMKEARFSSYLFFFENMNFFMESAKNTQDWSIKYRSREKFNIQNSLKSRGGFKMEFPRFANRLNFFGDFAWFCIFQKQALVQRLPYNIRINYYKLIFWLFLPSLMIMILYVLLEFQWVTFFLLSISEGCSVWVTAVMGRFRWW